MFAQRILELVLLGLVSYIFWRFFGKEIYQKMNESPEQTKTRLEEKVAELEEVTSHLEDIKNEEEVSSKLTILKRQLDSEKQKLENTIRREDEATSKLNERKEELDRLRKNNKQ